MISNNIKLPLTALVGGAAALLLRMWNLRAGFETASRLPVPGHPSFPATVAALALTLAVTLILSRRLSDGGAPRFPVRAVKRSFVTPVVAGAFVLACAGLVDLYEAFSGENLRSALSGSSLSYEYAFANLIDGKSVGFSPLAQGFAGLLTLVSAWAVFECARACLHGNLRSRAMVMVPAVALAFRLVALYRVDSVNPTLETYALVLMAFVFQTLGFYAFSAFAFDCGDLRQFAAATGGAVCLTLCALTDEGDYLSTPLTLAGSASALLGLLLLALDAPRVPVAASKT